MKMRPWPLGYDSMILRAVESALPALAERFERTELETRIRWYELKDRFKYVPADRRVDYTNAGQRKKMVEMRAAGEKIEYIAMITGFSTTCVSKHTAKAREHA